ncbi:hypothetical protein ACNVEB_001292 [Streptococcus equinus]|uniref:hypothetical protein n=1 Tax=Streptococcus equinus TaxID=1335 RepID=UPI003BF7D5D1
MDYTVLAQSIISLVIATISGTCSYLASRANNKAELEKQANDHIHNLKTLENDFNHQIEQLKQQHELELEKIKQAHDLRLQELEKTSQLNAETDKNLKINELAMKTLSGEINLGQILAISEQAQNYNQKQGLQQNFVKKTSRKL